MRLVMFLSSVLSQLSHTYKKTEAAVIRWNRPHFRHMEPSSVPYSDHIFRQCL